MLLPFIYNDCNLYVIYNIMKIILLKHGKKYTADDVNRQAESLKKYCDYDIFCFTEDPKDVIIDTIPLPRKPKLMRWWNKLHLFNTTFKPFNKCVLFDLDIKIKDNPFPIINSIDWTIPHFIEDYWKKDLKWNPHAYDTMLNSSIMAWTPHKNIEYWTKFSENIDYNTRKYAGIDRYIWDKKLNYGIFDNEIHSKIIL